MDNLTPHIELYNRKTYLVRRIAKYRPELDRAGEFGRLIQNRTVAELENMLELKRLYSGAFGNPEGL